MVWLVAVLSLAWNSFGGFDYTMSHLRGEAYFREAGMTGAQIAALNAMPTWMHAVWAVGVWGSVAGSLLLLVRSKWAFHAFAVSALGAIVSLVYQLADPATRAAYGAMLVMPVIIVLIVLALVWFSRTMTARGVLR